VITARFLHPCAAFSEYHADKITFMPPPVYILTTIRDIFVSFPDRATQRAKIQELSDGKFGKMVINPRRTDGNTNGHGNAVLTYQGDEARGGIKGRLHRSEVKVGDGGVRMRDFLLITGVFIDSISILHRSPPRSFSAGTLISLPRLKAIGSTPGDRTRRSCSRR